MLERSVDHGRTFTPWQYFARECVDVRHFSWVHDITWHHWLCDLFTMDALQYAVFFNFIFIFQ